MDYSSHIDTIPDFPKAGIQFRDVGSLLRKPEIFAAAIDDLAAYGESRDVDALAAVEARGFLFAPALALRLRVPLTMIRKPGKLPGAVDSESYTLEYGESALEMQHGAMPEGRRVMLVDDLLATGGTALAACRLIRRCGAEAAAAIFVVDLPDLGGREKLEAEGVAVHALCRF